MFLGTQKVQTCGTSGAPFALFGLPAGLGARATIPINPKTLNPKPEPEILNPKP